MHSSMEAHCAPLNAPGAGDAQYCGWHLGLGPDDPNIGDLGSYGMDAVCNWKE